MGIPIRNSPAAASREAGQSSPASGTGRLAGHSSCLASPAGRIQSSGRARRSPGGRCAQTDRMKKRLVAGFTLCREKIHKQYAQHTFLMMTLSVVCPFHSFSLCIKMATGGSKLHGSCPGSGLKGVYSKETFPPTVCSTCHERIQQSFPVNHQASP